MVKDHSDSERGNLLVPLHGLLILIVVVVCFLGFNMHIQSKLL